MNVQGRSIITDEKYSRWEYYKTATGYVCPNCKACYEKPYGHCPSCLRNMIDIDRLTRMETGVEVVERVIKGDTK